MTSDLENDIVAVERTKEYSEIDSEVRIIKLEVPVSKC